MIAGVDHLNLSCANVEAAISTLIGEGFRLEFLEPSRPNPPAKRGLLRSYEPTLSLAYCSASAAGIALELTEHAVVVAQGPSPFQVVLSARPSTAVEVAEESSWSSVLSASLGCRRPRLVRWPAFETEVWYDAEAVPKALSVSALLVPVEDVERARSFWLEGLGLAAGKSGEADGRRWQRVAVRAPLPRWTLELVLAEGFPQSRPRPLLDDAGFPCLGLLTSDLEGDLDRLAQFGATGGTGPFEIVVNDRPLHVAMLTGPDGEIVELLEVPAGSGVAASG